MINSRNLIYTNILDLTIIFKDNVCEMKIGVFNLKDIFNIISHKVTPLTFWNLRGS